jgi:uncharacterized membrane protein
MALDHVRDFFHVTAFTDDPLNLATTTPLLFFTRWITHFCAPTFVFLSGTSAWFVRRRKTKKETSVFLIKRGLWLVFAEMAIVNLGMTFNPLYNLLIWQVIWAIGWSMVILGLLVRTSLKLIAIVGFILVFGHDILDFIQLPKDGAANFFLRVFLTATGTIFQTGKMRFIGDFYAILPWTGVMLLGYVFGTVYNISIDAIRRRKIILTLGFAITIFFILIRYINVYGDPVHWAIQPRGGMYTFLSFINASKYPPSLCYVTMTLGPALIFLSLIETVQNKATNILSMYGRVPFFYYVLHFYLIHTIGVILFFATGHTSKDIIDMNTPFLFRPQHYGFALPVVYLIWLSVVIILYKPCKWFDQYRKTHTQWWLSYL